MLLPIIHPWGLLNVSDPSRREILIDRERRRVVPGVRIAVYAYRSGPEGAEPVSRLPREPERTVSYSWEPWAMPR